MPADPTSATARATSHPPCRAFTVWFRRVFLPRRLPGVDLANMNDLNEVQAMVSERFESWTERWERQGMEKGLQQGLQRQRHGLLRLVRKRFGAAVAEQSAPLLDRIADAEVLEELGEVLLDSPDGAAWLQALRARGGA
jgi:hypothetical protein